MRKQPNVASSECRLRVQFVYVGGAVVIREKRVEPLARTRQRSIHRLIGHHVDEIVSMTGNLVEGVGELAAVVGRPHSIEARIRLLLRILLRVRRVRNDAGFVDSFSVVLDGEVEAVRVLRVGIAVRGSDCRLYIKVRIGYLSDFRSRSRRWIKRFVDIRKKISQRVIDWLLQERTAVGLNAVEVLSGELPRFQK